MGCPKAFPMANAANTKKITLRINIPCNLNFGYFANNVLNRFSHFIESEKLLSRSEKYLLALSGGVDSIVLGSLLHQAGFSFEAAHVNFNLRGKDSIQDFLFCQEWCKKRNIPFHVFQADALQYSKEKKLSIQMAAREIRFQFFHDIISSHRLKALLTAHHLNDQTENLLLYLLRNNLHAAFYGIDPLDHRGLIARIRPLMFATKKEIIDYALSHEIPWREDVSNAKNQYKRNEIRNIWIPELETSWPEIHMETNETCKAYRTIAQKWPDALIHQTLHSKIFNGESFPEKKWLASLGFHYKTIQQILHTHKIGAVFNSKKGKLFRNRDGWKFIPRATPDLQISSFPIEINEMDIPFQFHYPGGSWNIEWTEECKPENNTWHFERDQIVFPIQITQRKNGDYFYPYKLDRKKKLSDFLINAKIERDVKDQLAIIRDSIGILLVDHLRASNRWKGDPLSKNNKWIRFQYLK